MRYISIGALCGFYLIGMFLTYGHVYTMAYEKNKSDYPNLSNGVWESSSRFEASVPALVWPVYWGGALSVQLMGGPEA